jgi:hypothetical protein
MDVDFEAVLSYTGLIIFNLSDFISFLKNDIS